MCIRDRKNTAKSKVKLNVLYEDENVIFLNKPVGMLSQKANREDTSLVEYLIEYLLDSGQVTREELKTFHPAVCNRLDRNTSGIVAGGKTLSALQILNEMFRTRSLEKYYLCLVSGKIKDGQRICGYLKKNTKTNKVSVTKEKRETKDCLLYTSWNHFTGRRLLLLCTLKFLCRNKRRRSYISGRCDRIYGRYGIQ